MSKHSHPFDDFDNEDDDGRGDEPDGADMQVERVMQESDEAIQVVMLDTGDMKWIPKSVIHTDSEVYEKPRAGYAGGGKLVVHMWFAEQEGLV